MSNTTISQAASPYSPTSDAPNGARVRGIVKWFSDEKGYGFVEPAVRGPDVFVHFSGIRGKGHKKLEEGEEVEYVLEQTPKGAQAVDVIVIDQPNAE